MVKVSIISKPNEKSKNVRTDTHVLEQFPSWKDMIELCRKDNVRATDFEHKKLNDRFFVGKILSKNFHPTENLSKGSRYGVRFYVSSDRAVTLKDVVR